MPGKRHPKRLRRKSLAFYAKPLKERPWLVLDEPSKYSFVFSLMCYNVLCDKYCSRQIYGYSPRWSLRWDHRQRLILDEICNCNADVVCLQVKMSVKDTMKSSIRF